MANGGSDVKVLRDEWNTMETGRWCEGERVHVRGAVHAKALDGGMTALRESFGSYQ